MDQPMTCPELEEFPRDDFIAVAHETIRNRELTPAWLEFIDANAKKNPEMPWELWAAICVWHLSVHNTLAVALGDGVVDPAYDFESRMKAVAKDVFTKRYAISTTHISQIKEGLRNEMRRLSALEWIDMHNRLHLILQEAAYELFKKAD